MIWTLRAIFVTFAALAGWRIGEILSEGQKEYYGVQGFFIGLGVGMLISCIEAAFTRRFASIISTVMFGLIFGFIASYLVINVLFLVPWIATQKADIKTGLQFSLTAIFCYLSVIAIIQIRDDFKFVIPFIELSREGRSGKPMLLDTSVIIDGRIADLCDARVVDAPLMVPRFVLQELQTIADSEDRTRRARGRRGLDVLNRIRKNRNVDLQIYEGQPPGIEAVDEKLVRVAKVTAARLVTNDQNLKRIAQLQAVDVINLNEIAAALRPPVLPGEPLSVQIVKAGEEAGQGVGYLEDGTMVVVEGGHPHVGQRVDLNVTNVIPTSAGRMIFASLRGAAPQAGPLRPSP